MMGSDNASGSDLPSTSATLQTTASEGWSRPTTGSQSRPQSSANESKRGPRSSAAFPGPTPVSASRNPQSRRKKTSKVVLELQDLAAVYRNGDGGSAAASLHGSRQPPMSGGQLDASAGDEELYEVAVELFLRPADLFANWKGSLLLVELFHRYERASRIRKLVLRTQIGQLVRQAGSTTAFRASRAYLFQALDNYTSLAAVWEQLLDRQRDQKNEVAAAQRRHTGGKQQHQIEVQVAERALRRCHLALSSIENYRQCSEMCLLVFRTQNIARKWASRRSVAVPVVDEMTVGSSGAASLRQEATRSVQVDLLTDLRATVGGSNGAGNPSHSFGSATSSVAGPLHFFGSLDPSKTVVVHKLDPQISKTALVRAFGQRARRRSDKTAVQSISSEEGLTNGDLEAVVMPLEVMSNLRHHVYNLCRAYILPCFLQLQEEIEVLPCQDESAGVLNRVHPSGRIPTDLHNDSSVSSSKDSDANSKVVSRQSSRPVSRQSSGLPSRQSSILFIDIPLDDEAGGGVDDAHTQKSKDASFETFAESSAAQPPESQRQAAMQEFDGDGVLQQRSSSKPTQAGRSTAQFWTTEESAALQSQLHALRKSIDKLSSGRLCAFLLKKLVEDRLCSPSVYPMTEENNLPSGLTFQSAQNVDTLADGTFLPTETTLDSQALQVRASQLLGSKNGLNFHDLEEKRSQTNAFVPKGEMSDVVAPVDAFQHNAGAQKLHVSNGSANPGNVATAAPISLQFTRPEQTAMLSSCCTTCVAEFVWIAQLTLIVAVISLVIAFVNYSDQATGLMAAFASSLGANSTSEVFFAVLAVLLALLLILTLVLPSMEVWRQGCQWSFPTCDATNVLFLVSVSVQVTLLGVALSLRLNMMENLSWGVLDSSSPSAGIHTLTIAYCVMLGIVATCTLCRQLLLRGFCKASRQFPSRKIIGNEEERGAVKITFPSLWYFCETVGCWCCRRRLRCRGFVTRHCRNCSGSTIEFGKYQTVPAESVDSISKGHDPLDSINAHSSWGSQKQSGGFRERCKELTLGFFGSCCRRMYRASPAGLKRAMLDMQSRRLQLISTTRAYPAKNERIPEKFKLEQSISSYRRELAFQSRQLSYASRAPPTLQPAQMAQSCFNCGQPFNFAVARKNCHHCGQVFCHYCARHLRRIPTTGVYTHRLSVCVRCVRWIDGQAQTETQLRRLLSHFFTTYDPERLQREPVGNDTAAWFFDNLSSLNSRLLQEYDTDLFGFTAVQSFLYALGSTQRSRFTDSALKKLQPQSHLNRKLEVFYQVFDTAKAAAMMSGQPLSSCCSGQDLAEAVLLQEAVDGRDQVILNKALKTKYHANIASLKVALLAQAGVHGV